MKISVCTRWAVRVGRVWAGMQGAGTSFPLSVRRLRTHSLSSSSMKCPFFRMCRSTLYAFPLLLLLHNSNRACVPHKVLLSQCLYVAQHTQILTLQVKPMLCCHFRCEKLCVHLFGCNAPAYATGADFVFQFSRVLHLRIGIDGPDGFVMRQVANCAYLAGACRRVRGSAGVQHGVLFALTYVTSHYVASRQ